MEVMVILPYPPQLQDEHKDPCVLDQDNNIIQESVENKSWSKWLIVISATILEVIVILFCHLQLQEEQKDAWSLDLLRVKIQLTFENKSC